ncbi:MAG: heparinase [Candidatus Bathyarchaeota archaeon B26-2]|nr:MAG: heparinase [Candidatus Bathyarchaeota archaeon B26-2]
MTKKCSRTVTAAMRATAVANAKRFEWAKRERDAIVKRAAPILKMSDKHLWELVPSQELPRTVHVQLLRGNNRVSSCPNCGPILKYGNYPWICNVESMPWKIKCPNCHEVYPKNDFGAYYRSALDRHGFFRRGAGDPRLLFNVEHPDPDDPLHKAWVDDGYGYNDPQTGRWDFIAYYVQWGLWPYIRNLVTNAAEAYCVTDDPRYAHKAGVLLSRIADVYPDMDWAPLNRLGFSHSDGGSGAGRIEGQIWETRNAFAYSLAYDRIYDAISRDYSLSKFLDKQARKHDLPSLPSPAAVCRHIEEDLLLEFYKSARDGRIRGNEGMCQAAMIATAIALDREGKTEEILDWVFAPDETPYRPRQPGYDRKGGHVPQVIVGLMDRDGLGNEGAPGYSCWGLSLLPGAELLRAYTKYRKHDFFRDFPKFKQVFLAPTRWCCLDEVTPPIGDSGILGGWKAVGRRAHAFQVAFEIYGDPIFARYLYREVGKKIERIHGSIYDADPLAIRAKVEKVINEEEPPLQSGFMDGFGLVILQAPQRRWGRAVWLYFGRNTGHGHTDRLNLGLYAENIDMLPDMGYPEYASGRPRDLAWTRNCASHNVAIIGDENQRRSYTGHLQAFEPEGRVRFATVSSDDVYPHSKTYSRTPIMVDVDERRSYVVDVVRLRGSNVHRLMWHGPPGTLTIPDVDLKPQSRGTFAGEDVPPEHLEKDWPRKPGYSFLQQVKRCADPPRIFYADYKAEDIRNRFSPGAEPHLRIHSLTPLSEVATAVGEPPQNKPGNPKWLNFIIQTRTGDDLESLFINVLEPYDKTPFIESVRPLRVVSDDSAGMVAAVEVTLTDGRVDTIVSIERSARVEVENGLAVEGTFGFVARRGERVEFAKLCGRELRIGSFRLEGLVTAYRGKVIRLDVDDPYDQRVVVSSDLPLPESLAGRTVFFSNDGVQDAAYVIVRVERNEEGYVISTGDVTLARGFVDPEDYSKGFVYNVRPGDPFVIPTHIYVELTEGDRYKVSANAPVKATVPLTNNGR